MLSGEQGKVYNKIENCTEIRKKKNKENEIEKYNLFSFSRCGIIKSSKSQFCRGKTMNVFNFRYFMG